MIWPLSKLTSLKAKISIIIVLAVGVTALMSIVGFRLGWPVWVRPVISAALALVMVQIAARGITSPLRDMTAHTQEMARGDYSNRVHTDSVDEVGQLADAFNAMAADLAEVDQQRRALIANVSHELRTPIAALQVNLENLIDEVSTFDEASLDVMLRQTQRLGRLVHQLLDLSRLEAGSSRLTMDEFSLGSVINQTVEECLLHEPTADITVSIESDVRLVGDSERIHQVAANLIQNAIRHSPAGTSVRVSAERTDGATVLEVADLGPGIPLDEAELVFERFYRADGSRSSQAGGTGLGLAIAKWIVDMHGGTIRAEQNAPHGCRMVVHIPDQRELIHPG